MELSTTTRGKAKLLWMPLWNSYAYTKHIEKNGMIRWHGACRVSKHCPASAYTDLLPARIYGLPKCLLPKRPISITKTSYYQKCPVTEISCYRNVMLPKCLLPKRPLPKCPLPKCLDTRLSSVADFWCQASMSSSADGDVSMHLIN